MPRLIGNVLGFDYYFEL